MPLSNDGGTPVAGHLPCRQPSSWTWQCPLCTLTSPRRNCHSAEIRARLKTIKPVDGINSLNYSPSHTSSTWQSFVGAIARKVQSLDCYPGLMPGSRKITSKNGESRVPFEIHTDVPSLCPVLGIPPRVIAPSQSALDSQFQLNIALDPLTLIGQRTGSLRAQKHATESLIQQ